MGIKQSNVAKRLKLIKPDVIQAVLGESYGQYLTHGRSHTKIDYSGVYVAMTRATYRLVIPYVEETELIARMKKCLSD